MASLTPLVLLTGATGFVGYLTLIDLLNSGYRVRVAVRSQAKANKVSAAPSVKAISPSPNTLSFAVVPDMATDGAFDDAAKDVTYIVHIASPVPSFGADTALTAEQYEKYFVQDAVASHVNILKSAAAAGGSVKRVVLTSSCMGIMPFEYYTGAPTVDYNVIFGPTSRAPTPTGPFSNEVQAYAGGKVAALNAAEKWMAENGETVAFDLINIIPGFIFGRNELAESVAELRVGSTNSILLNLLLGSKNEWPYNGNAILGTDVAKLHVLALDPKVKGNQSFVASTPIIWEDAMDVLRTTFSAELEAGRFSVEGKQPTLPIKMDGTKTEEALGIKFAPYEDQVKQVAEQYLELLAKAA